MHSVKDSFYITPGAPSPIEITKEPISVQFQELEPEVATDSQLVFRIRYPTPDALLDPYVILQSVLRCSCNLQANQAVNNTACWPEEPWQLWKFMNNISITWNGVTYSMPGIKEYAELLMYSDNEFTEMAGKTIFSPVASGKWSGFGGRTAHEAASTPGGGTHPYFVASNVASGARYRMVHLDQATVCARQLVGVHHFMDLLFRQPLPLYPFRYADNQVLRYNPIPYVSDMVVRMDFSFGARTSDMPISTNHGPQVTAVNLKHTSTNGGLSVYPRLLLRWYIRPPTVAPLPKLITLGGFPSYRYFSELKEFDYLGAASTSPSISSRHYTLRGVPSRLWIVWQKAGNDIELTTNPKVNYFAYKSVTIYLNGRAVQKNLDHRDCFNLWKKNGPKDSALTASDFAEGGKCIGLFTASDLGQEFSKVSKPLDLWIQGTWQDLCCGAAAAANTNNPLRILVEYGPGNITVGKQFARIHEPPLITEAQVLASTQASSSSVPDKMETDGYQSRV